eukprot:1679849-Pleurochrysis_carterae.AAC.1
MPTTKRESASNGKVGAHAAARPPRPVHASPATQPAFRPHTSARSPRTSAPHSMPTKTAVCTRSLPETPACAKGVVHQKASAVTYDKIMSSAPSASWVPAQSRSKVS